MNALTRGQGASISGVSGLGGIGKSALASIVATLVAPNFPDARMWVALNGTDKNPKAPSDAMREIIFAFDPETGAALKDASDAQLAHVYLGVLHDQRALIVLDNARDNAQVRPLLQANAAFLITARANLTEGGLQPLHLGVMKADEAEAYVLSICPRLGTSPPAPLLRGEGSVLDELCAVCGYLPLALKITGSYLAARPNVRAENYVARLKQARLELLREGREAEANVEATFLQTYEQLTLSQQILFCALSVFPAPFTLQAAAYVCGLEETQTEAALGELVRASYLEMENSPLLQGEGPGVRYLLHDLLREFGETRQTDDNRRQAAKRHAEFYMQVARAADELYLQGNENILAGLKLFDDELPHIRAGQAWAAANMERDDDAARLCSDYPDAAVYVGDLRLSAREQIRWLEQAARAAKQRNDKRMEGAHLGSLGNAYADLGDVRKAIAFYEQRIEIAREIGDRRGEGNALGNLGNAYADLGDVHKAIAYYEQALAVMREIGDKRAEGSILGNLGAAYYSLGDVRKAIEYHEQYLAIAREIGDRRGEGNALGNLGNAYAALGDVRKAIAFYEQRIEIAREIGDRRGEGNALGNLGNAYADLGDVHKAIGYHEQDLAIRDEIGDKRGKGNALGNLGNAYASLGDVRKAIAFYEQGIETAREIGDRRGEGNALGNLGLAHADLGDARRAIEYHEQALVIRREIGDRRGEGADLANMGNAYKTLGDMDKAKKLWRAALAIFEAIEDPNAEKVRGWLKALDRE